jgi:hypothetical protein
MTINPLFDFFHDLQLMLFMDWFGKIEIGNLDSALCNKGLRCEFLCFLESREYYVKANFCENKLIMVKVGWHLNDKFYNVWLSLRFVKVKELTIYSDVMDCSSFVPDLVEQLILLNTRNMREAKVVNCFNMFKRLISFSSKFNVTDYFFQHVNHEILTNLTNLHLDGGTLRTFDCIQILSNVCKLLTRLKLYFHRDVAVADETYQYWTNLFISNRLDWFDFNLGCDKWHLIEHIVWIVGEYMLKSSDNCELNYFETGDVRTINPNGLVNNLINIRNKIDDSQFLSLAVNVLDQAETGVSITLTHHKDKHSEIKFNAVDKLDLYSMLDIVFQNSNANIIQLSNLSISSPLCELLIAHCTNLRLIFCTFIVGDVCGLLTRCKLSSFSIVDEEADTMNTILSLLCSGRNCLIGLGFYSPIRIVSTLDILHLIANCTYLENVALLEETLIVDWDFVYNQCAENKRNISFRFFEKDQFGYTV